MKKNTKIKKKIKLSMSEKLLYFIAIFVVVLAPVAIVFSKATLSEVNYQVEKQKKAIEKQKKKNESLTMSINELASLSKIQEVAQEQGLSYNSNNVKTITEDDGNKE